MATMGPLQMLVVNFDEANFSGEIDAELTRLEDSGTLRVLDVLVVAKTADGEIEVVRSKTEIARVVKGDGLPAGRELTSDEWDIADAIEPGGAAAIAILEHTWVGPLREAIERAGGHHITAEWTEPEELASWGVSLTT